MLIILQLYRLICSQFASYEMGGGQSGFDAARDVFPLQSENSPGVLPGSSLDDLLQTVEGHMSPEELQAFSEEFNERLAGLTLDRGFVKGQIMILINGLRPILEGRYPGYSSRDPEYTQLLGVVRGLEQIHSQLVSDIGALNSEIQDRLRSKMNTIQQSLSGETTLQGDSPNTGDISVVAENNHVDPSQIEEDSEPENNEGEELTPEQLNELQSSIDILVSDRNTMVDAIRSQIESVDFENASRELRDKIHYFSDLRQDFPQGMDSIEERLDFISNQVSQLQELQVMLEIRLRDESLVGEGEETFGEARRTLIERKYQELQENGTEVQKNIIQDIEGNFIEFSELTQDQLGALRRAGVDLAKYLLIDEEGNEFSGTYEQGQSFIINSAGNQNIGGYLLAYIFDIQQVAEITVGGQTFTRDTTNAGGTNRGFLDGETFIGNIRDGMRVEITRLEAISDEDFEPVQQAIERSFGIDRSSAIMGQIYGAYEATRESTGFNFNTFLEALKNGDLSTLVDQLTHLLKLEFDFDEETGMYSLNDPSNPNDPGGRLQVSEADMRLGVLSDLPPSHRANFIRSARENGMSPEELMNFVNAECGRFGFPPPNFISLISKESGWRSWIRNQSGSSAFGLGQMIDSTWRRFGSGNRNDPRAQITGSLNYLRHILNTNGCTPADAVAFYNTGAAFRVDHNPAPANYIRQNSVIVNGIPPDVRARGITRRVYFIAAVAYYNSINYATAWDQSKYGRRMG